MKKLSAFLLVFIMVFSFASCGEEKPEPEKETTSPVQETTTLPQEEKPEGIVPITVSAEEAKLVDRADNSDMLLTEVSYQTLSLSEKDAKMYPGLSQALDSLNKEQKAYSEKEFAEIKEWAREDYAESDPGYFYGYTNKIEYLVQRADSLVLSVRSEWDSYTGGAHPNYGTGCYNYDTETGKELSLSDVITDVSQIPEIVSEILIARNPMEPFGDLKGKLSEYKEEQFNWAIGNQSITFYFSPYEIAAFASGSFAATIFFDENPDLFNEKYTETANSYFYEIPAYSDIELDIDEEDTHTDWIHITPEEYEGGYYTVLNVSVNGEELKTDNYKFYESRYYLVNKSGAFSLCAELYLSDNSITTVVFDIRGDKAEVREVLKNTKFADADIIQ